VSSQGNLQAAVEVLQATQSFFSDVVCPDLGEILAVNVGETGMIAYKGLRVMVSGILPVMNASKHHHGTVLGMFHEPVITTDKTDKPYIALCITDIECIKYTQRHLRVVGAEEVPAVVTDATILRGLSLRIPVSRVNSIQEVR
jgi:hypothetical protein